MFQNARDQQKNNNLESEISALKNKYAEKKNLELPSTSSSPSNEDMAYLKVLQEELLDYKAMVFKRDEDLKESYRMCQELSDEVDELEDIGGKHRSREMHKEGEIRWPC